MLNRDPESNPEDLSTYGKNAVIWAPPRDEPIVAASYRWNLKTSVYDQEKKEAQLIPFNIFKHKFNPIESTKHLRLLELDAIFLLKKQFFNFLYSTELTLSNLKNTLNDERQRMASTFGEYDNKVLILKNKIIQIENLIEKIIQETSKVNDYKNNYRRANAELNHKFSTILNEASILISFTENEQQTLFKSNETSKLMQALNSFGFNANKESSLQLILNKTSAELKAFSRRNQG